MPQFAFFKNNNTDVGLAPNAQFQYGVSDTDSGKLIEQGVKLPWTIDPATSWLAYECWIEVDLDAGLVRHKPLPQSADPIDTLASIEVYAPNADSFVNGVNLKSFATGADVIQRMSSSTYTFTLKGRAMRAGYQIPVPGLVSVGGVPAYPAERQWSLGNRIAGNYNGIPVWENAWLLQYYVSVPPKVNQLPPPNIGEHIRGDVQLPDGIRPPWTPVDQNSTPQNPNLRLGDNPNQRVGQ